MTHPRRSRRWRWLTARLPRRRRPRPVVIRVGNADSVTTGPHHAARIFERLLTRRARGRPRRSPDIVAAVECSDFDAQTVAGHCDPGTWRIVQHGGLGTPESALVAAVRRDRVRIDDTRLQLGTRPTSEGGGIRARWILELDVTIDPGTPHEWTPPTLRIGHAHPSRAPHARETFMDAMRGEVVALGDFNLSPAAVAGWFPGTRIHNAGVIAAAVPHWIASRARRLPTWLLRRSDHDALDLTLWPRRLRRRHHRKEKP